MKALPSGLTTICTTFAVSCTLAPHDNCAATDECLLNRYCGVPRLAVRNQHPHDPVRMRYGSAAPESLM